MNREVISICVAGWCDAAEGCSFGKVTGLNLEARTIHDRACRVGVACRSVAGAAQVYIQRDFGGATLILVVGEME